MQISKYQMTVEQLLTALQQPDPQALDAAIEGLSAFAENADSLNRLQHELSDNLSTRLSCQACQQLLPAALVSADAPTQSTVLSADNRAALALHLVQCPDCLLNYRLLHDLESLAAEPEMTFPAADLSFLAPRWEQTTDWCYQLWHSGSQVVRVVLRLAEELAAPPVPLKPLAVKGVPLVDSPRRSIVRQVNLTPTDSDDLDIEAVIWHVPHDVHSYALTVRVQVPSRWPDLAGTAVYATAAEWSMEGTTDAEGMVQFKGLPAVWLDQLTITVDM